MANVLYPKAKERFLSGELSWPNDRIEVILVNMGLDGYSLDLEHDEFLDDVPTNAVVSWLKDNVERPTQLLNKTVENGVADAQDCAFEDVQGDLVHAIIIFKRGASPETSPLIVFKDTGFVLPVEPDGRDITISWDNGPNRIFSL